MASSLIHICVAKEVNKYLNRDESQFLIGAIAPDIAKLINISRDKTHFIDYEENIPNLDRFIDKYKSYLNNDFVLGYYIHLYTDYIWFKYFVPSLIDDNKIIKLNNKKENFDEKKFTEYVYDDYGSVNKKLIDDYNLDLKIFYEDIPKIDDIIEEIPIEKIKVIVDKAGLIIIESKEKDNILFDEDLINEFIEYAVDATLANIDNLNIKNG